MAFAGILMPSVLNGTPFRFCGGLVFGQPYRPLSGMAALFPYILYISIFLKVGEPAGLPFNVFFSRAWQLAFIASIPPLYALRFCFTHVCSCLMCGNDPRNFLFPILCAAVSLRLLCLANSMRGKSPSLRVFSNSVFCNIFGMRLGRFRGAG